MDNLNRPGNQFPGPNLQSGPQNNPAGVIYSKKDPRLGFKKKRKPRFFLWILSVVLLGIISLSALGAYRNGDFNMLVERARASENCPELTVLDGDFCFYQAKEIIDSSCPIGYSRVENNCFQPVELQRIEYSCPAAATLERDQCIYAPSESNSTGCTLGGNLVEGVCQFAATELNFAETCPENSQIRGNQCLNGLVPVKDYVCLNGGVLLNSMCRLKLPVQTLLASQIEGFGCLPSGAVVGDSVDCIFTFKTGFSPAESYYTSKIRAKVNAGFQKIVDCHIIEAKIKCDKIPTLGTTEAGKKDIQLAFENNQFVTAGSVDLLEGALKIRPENVQQSDTCKEDLVITAGQEINCTFSLSGSPTGQYFIEGGVWLGLKKTQDSTSGNVWLPGTNTKNCEVLPLGKEFKLVCRGIKTATLAEGDYEVLMQISRSDLNLVGRVKVVKEELNLAQIEPSSRCNSNYLVKVSQVFSCDIKIANFSSQKLTQSKVSYRQGLIVQEFPDLCLLKISQLVCNNLILGPGFQPGIVELWLANGNSEVQFGKVTVTP